MPTIQVNEFTSYNLTEEEIQEGSKLTYLQTCIIQNLLARAAQDKLLYVPDVNSPLNKLYEEAYLAGRIDVLREILTAAANADTLEF